MFISDNDLRSYYRGTMATYQGKPVFCHEFQDGMATVTFPLEPGDAAIQVNARDLDHTIPTLGWVKYGAKWIYLYRLPQRKMTKGYCGSLIKAVQTSGLECDFNAFNSAVLNQLWFKRRPHPQVILSGPDLYYQTERVGHQGSAIEGKEKLFAIAQKYLEAV